MTQEDNQDTILAGGADTAEAAEAQTDREWPEVGAPWAVTQDDERIEGFAWADNILFVVWRNGPICAYRGVNEHTMKAAMEFKHGPGLYIREFVKGKYDFQKQSSFGTDNWTRASAEPIAEASAPEVSEAKQAVVNSTHDMTSESGSEVPAVGVAGLQGADQLTETSAAAAGIDAGDVAKDDGAPIEVLAEAPDMLDSYVLPNGDSVEKHELLEAAFHQSQLTVEDWNAAEPSDRAGWVAEILGFLVRSNAETAQTEDAPAAEAAA